MFTFNNYCTICLKIVIVYLFVMCVGCKVSSKQTETYRQGLGIDTAGFVINYNSDSSYFIAVQSQNVSEPYMPTNIFIYNITSSAVVFNDRQKYHNAGWENDSVIWLRQNLGYVVNNNRKKLSGPLERNYKLFYFYTNSGKLKEDLLKTDK